MNDKERKAYHSAMQMLKAYGIEDLRFSRFRLPTLFSLRMQYGRHRKVLHMKLSRNQEGGMIVEGNWFPRRVDVALVVCFLCMRNSDLNPSIAGTNEVPRIVTRADADRYKEL